MDTGGIGTFKLAFDLLPVAGLTRLEESYYMSYGRMRAVLTSGMRFLVVL